MREYCRATGYSLPKLAESLRRYAARPGCSADPDLADIVESIYRVFQV